MEHQALIIDDEADIRELLELTLSHMGVSCHSAASLEQAYGLLQENHFDLCLTDMRLPDGEGIELIRRAQESYPELPIAVITAYGNMQIAIDSLKAGAFDFIAKPVRLKTLRKLVRNALDLASRQQDKQAHDSNLLGESAAIQKVRAMVNKLARSQAPVHICGESGTGKELAAREIHLKSARSKKSFIAVNCGAVPAELMESEFFGHKKGSFTGAHHDSEGLFQAADGGTLFLDEVADLPPAMQVKLLRTIQERSVRPVGSQTEKAVDVRILSATNKKLKQMVENNVFRDDLYFRLNVIELRLPALRERDEDILLLARHTLNRLNREARLDASAEAALLNYPFPGNIRELENILERTHTLADGTILSADDLQLQQGDSRELSTLEKQPLSRDNRTLEAYLSEIESHEITKALERSRWNRVNAALLLGMTPRQLRYRMQKLGLSE